MDVTDGLEADRVRRRVTDIRVLPPTVRELHRILEVRLRQHTGRVPVESDLLECVLGLGAGLFYNSPMEACVLVCRAQKSDGRKGRVLFINAVTEFSREQAQSFLRTDLPSLFFGWSNKEN